MNRRQFNGFLAGAAALWPLAGAAQARQGMRRLGVLMPFPKDDRFLQPFVTAFVRALSRLGWSEGKNIRIDYRFAAGDPDLFRRYAAELVKEAPDAILASTGPAVEAVQEQTHTIPIVFVLLPDPVALGFVKSLARPGGNLTGFSSFNPPLMGKWIELLREVAPRVRRVAVMFNPEISAGRYVPLFDRAIERAGASVGTAVTLAPVRNEAMIEAAIANEAREPGGGLITLPDSFISTHRDAIIAAAARHRLPLMGIEATWTRAGALLSYSFDSVELFAQAASYIDRIFKGAKPGDLPVQQPTTFKLAINIRTAKALGITIPPLILAQADEVIE